MMQKMGEAKIKALEEMNKGLVEKIDKKDGEISKLKDERLSETKNYEDKRA
jgi:hypothetical protein